MIKSRLFEEEDIEEVRELITETLRSSNREGYSEAYIEDTIQRMDDAFLIEKSIYTHFYVFLEDEKIVGTGAIGPFWGSETESSLFDIFVLPAYQGRGIERQIVEVLEQDGYFLKAKRVEISSSLKTADFYQKMGYDFKNGVMEPDDDGIVRLEKWS